MPSKAGRRTTISTPTLRAVEGEPAYRRLAVGTRNSPTLPAQRPGAKRQRLTGDSLTL
ncbi:hypothetical protein [Prevotella lacticifex]|uniref:hypothetical protein n=1 Tax=Prevotella lacticifex TaxID=2854755 RepID=UPI001CC77F78|nr:hypothetical protein [Prevotella lacticifex]